MMHVTVLYNPEAGDDSLDEGELRVLLKNAGHSATYHSTKANGWKTALDEPGDLVVVAGGDGTVAKVARRLAGRAVPMALLPAGTANNIARSLGFEGHPETLVERWMTARATPVDLGIVDGPMGERCFVEGTGLGVFPELMVQSPHRISKEMPTSEQIQLNLELMMELLERAKPVSCQVSADGRDLSGAYLVLELMNIRSIGPRIVFSPDADPTDGLLEIVAITEADRKMTIDFLRRSQNEDAGLFELPCVRAKSIQLAWKTEPVHVDDERWPAEEHYHRDEDAIFSARVTVKPGAFEVLF